MTIHEIKSWTDYFAPMWSGMKTFEIRRNDRHYQVGDVLQIREYDDRKAVYTGRQLKKRVVYMMEGIGAGSIQPLVGLQRGFVAMGLVDE